MKRGCDDSDDECPIHVQEDTTMVKRVALAVLILFLIGFIVFGGR